MTTDQTQALAPTTRIIITDGATGDEEWRGPWSQFVADNELDAETVAEAEMDLAETGTTLIGFERITAEVAS